MFQKNSQMLRALLIVFLVGVVLFVAISPAQALNSFLKSFNTHYPATNTDAAGCNTCHGGNSGTLNSYGKDICQQMLANPGQDMSIYLQAIEALDSDTDLSASSNMAEINANAQPGWTSGANPIYKTVADGCAPTGTTVSVPGDVPMPYDPPAAGDPVVVPGGPYAGNVNIPITMNGSASYDSDGGAILSYTWDFGDGATGSGATVQHTYTAAAIYTVTLTVVDDEGTSKSAVTTATISGAAVLDLDIAAFTTSSSVRLGKSVAISVAVENPGSVLGQAVATVVGTMNGTEVYRWQLNVYDNNKKGSTTFAFPAYTPKTKGTINWMVSIADVNPDIDEMTAVTLVK